MVESVAPRRRVREHGLPTSESSLCRVLPEKGPACAFQATNIMTQNSDNLSFRSVFFQSFWAPCAQSPTAVKESRRCCIQQYALTPSEPWPKLKSTCGHVD